MKNDRPDRPSALPVKEQAIPTELQDLPRWVVWSYELKTRRWGKVPALGRTGRHADVTDPLDLTDFKEALDCYRQQKFDGIGFTFLAEDGFTGIDLDKCRDPRTKGMAQWAQDILDGLDSYAELSPSGTGAKVYIRGRLPGNRGRRKGQVELYSAGRFFTVTGQHIPNTPTTVGHRQKELDQLYEGLFGGEGGRSPGEDDPLPSGLTDEQALKLARSTDKGG
jgi:primase-polymerase (primpol)-like protein